MICSDSISINAQNIDSLSDLQLKEAFDDMFQFCCSFVDKQAADNNPDHEYSCSIDFNCLTKFWDRLRKHLTEKNLSWK